MARETNNAAIESLLLKWQTFYEVQHIYNDVTSSNAKIPYLKVKLITSNIYIFDGAVVVRSGCRRRLGELRGRAFWWLFRGAGIPASAVGQILPIYITLSDRASLFDSITEGAYCVSFT